METRRTNCEMCSQAGVAATSSQHTGYTSQLQVWLRTERDEKQNWAHEQISKHHVHMKILKVGSTLKDHAMIVTVFLCRPCSSHKVTTLLTQPIMYSSWKLGSKRIHLRWTGFGIMRESLLSSQRCSTSRQLWCGNFRYLGGG